MFTKVMQAERKSKKNLKILLRCRGMHVLGAYAVYAVCGMTSSETRVTGFATCV